MKNDGKVISEDEVKTLITSMYKELKESEEPFSESLFYYLVDENMEFAHSGELRFFWSYVFEVMYGAAIPQEFLSACISSAFVAGAVDGAREVNTTLLHHAIFLRKLSNINSNASNVEMAVLLNAINRECVSVEKELLEYFKLA